MTADPEVFVAHIAGHAGISADRAARATRAVLFSISSSLSPPLRWLVASELPPALAAGLFVPDHVALPLDERVRVPGTTVAQSRELIARVAQALVDLLSPAAVLAIRGRAPTLLAAIFGAASGNSSVGRTAPASRTDRRHLASGARPSRRRDARTDSQPCASLASVLPRR